MINKIQERRLAATPVITRTELAKAAGVPYTTVTDIETGVSQNPGYYTVVALNNALTRLETERATLSSQEAKA